MNILKIKDTPTLLGNVYCQVPLFFWTDQTFHLDYFFFIQLANIC
jgi:hypothetical protein